MDGDLGSVQDKKAGSVVVSDLRARLDAKLHPNKDEAEQDESNKSSIRSLDSSFEMPKEEMSPIMKRINQFQAQSTASVSPKEAHSRISSTQTSQAAACLAPEDSAVSSTDSADNLSKISNRSTKPDSSTCSPIASPSVAALRSQLALNSAMLRPGEPGRPKANRNLSGKSTDLSSLSLSTDTVSNLPVLETPKTPSSGSGLTPSSLRASSRVSDIQQRLALDPNMLLPSPQSGPPSRSHRRGKSSASATPTSLDPEVSNGNQMNRPCIASKARRARTSAKFSCDQESNEVLVQIEKLTEELDYVAKALSTDPQDVNASQPDSQTAVGNASQPDSQTAVGNASQPDSQTAVANASQPDSQTAVANASQPNSQTAVCNASQPDSQTAVGNASQPDSQTAVGNDLQTVQQGGNSEQILHVHENCQLETNTTAETKEITEPSRIAPQSLEQNVSRNVGSPDINIHPTSAVELPVPSTDINETLADLEESGSNYLSSDRPRKCRHQTTNSSVHLIFGNADTEVAGLIDNPSQEESANHVASVNSVSDTCDCELMNPSSHNT